MGRDDNAILLYSLTADKQDNQIKHKKGQTKRYYSYSAKKKDEKFKLNTKI